MRRIHFHGRGVRTESGLNYVRKAHCASISLYVLPALHSSSYFVAMVERAVSKFVKTLSHWNYPISEWFRPLPKPPLHYYPVYLLATIPATYPTCRHVFHDATSTCGGGDDERHTDRP